MILFALALTMQAPTGLPAWAYTYELPGAPVVYPGGFGGGGFGGGSAPPNPQSPASPAPGQGSVTAPAPPKNEAPILLGELIPDFKGPSLGLGGRLDDALAARSLRRLDQWGNVLFTVDEGGTIDASGGGMRTSYLLDDHNNIQFGTSFVYVTAETSRARFDASRTAIERRFGAPRFGQRQGTSTLTLNWETPDGVARLDLETAINNTIWIRTTLARSSGPDRFAPPVPQGDGS